MNLHLNSIILLLLLFISCCSGLNAKVISGAPKQKPKVETPSTTTTTETVRTTPPASSTSSTTSSSSNSLRQPNEPSGFPNMMNLYGKCVSYQTHVYQYTLCPYTTVTQKDISKVYGGYEGTLGVWGHWGADETTQYIMYYTDGTPCGSKPRETTIRCECDENTEMELVSVEEPQTCHYTGILKTKYICKYMNQSSNDETATQEPSNETVGEENGSGPEEAGSPSVESESSEVVEEQVETVVVPENGGILENSVEEPSEVTAETDAETTAEVTTEATTETTAEVTAEVTTETTTEVTTETTTEVPTEVTPEPTPEPPHSPSQSSPQDPHDFSSLRDGKPSTQDYPMNNVQVKHPSSPTLSTPTDCSSLASKIDSIKSKLDDINDKLDSIKEILKSYALLDDNFTRLTTYLQHMFDQFSYE